MSGSSARGGAVRHAQLHLLDRQIIDHATGRMVGKVDDVDLDLDGPVPVVSGLLCGPGAWGPRLPGVLGRAVTGLHRRLHDPGAAADGEEVGRGEPTRIDWSHVVEIDSAVHVDGADLGPQALGAWLDEHLISRIPGARHASD